MLDDNMIGPDYVVIQNSHLGHYIVVIRISAAAVYCIGTAPEYHASKAGLIGYTRSRAVSDRYDDKCNDYYDIYHCQSENMIYIYIDREKVCIIPADT